MWFWSHFLHISCLFLKIISLKFDLLSCELVSGILILHYIVPELSMCFPLHAFAHSAVFDSYLTIAQNCTDFCDMGMLIKLYKINLIMRQYLQVIK